MSAARGAKSWFDWRKHKDISISILVHATGVQMNGVLSHALSHLQLLPTTDPGAVSAGESANTE